MLPAPILTICFFATGVPFTTTTNRALALKVPTYTCPSTDVNVGMAMDNSITPNTLRWRVVTFVAPGRDGYQASILIGLATLCTTLYLSIAVNALIFCSNFWHFITAGFLTSTVLPSPYLRFITYAPLCSLVLCSFLCITHMFCQSANINYLVCYLLHYSLSTFVSRYSYFSSSTVHATHLVVVLLTVGRQWHLI